MYLQLKYFIRPNSELCQRDFELLQNWTSDPTLIPMTLSDRVTILHLFKNNHNFLKINFYLKGRIELRYIARNFKRMFPQIFNTSYTPANYIFSHTETTRTEESFQNFADGLFGQMAHKSIQTIRENKRLQRPFIGCKSYRAYSGNADYEMSKFQKTNEFQEILKEVSLRLGMKGVLPIRSIWAMWIACVFESSDENSPWCAVSKFFKFNFFLLLNLRMKSKTHTQQAFTKKHMEMFEYAQDLKDYYLNSYGHRKTNDKLTCLLIQDMLRKMDNINDTPIVTAYFNHATTLFLLLTSLGTFEDLDGLRYNNYDRQYLRQFRGSEMSPFAGNIAVVRYQCNSHANYSDTEKILFLLNQKPLAMKWCKGGALCTIDEFKNMYKSSMRDCPWEICKMNYHPTQCITNGKHCVTYHNHHPHPHPHRQRDVVSSSSNVNMSILLIVICGLFKML